MSRILFFMPDNPLNTNSGNKSRAKSFLTYFKERGCEVDFFSEVHWGEWTNENLEEFKKSQLATNVYLLDRKSSKRNFIKYNFIKLKQMLINKLHDIDTRDIPNHATNYLLKQFYKIIKNKQYDYVVINYVSWARMVIDKSYFKGAKTIIDTHDFITSQRQNGNKKHIGDTFAEELKRLNLFDEIWAISTEEHYLFGQFFPERVKWMPMMAASKACDHAAIYKYDIIYVASDNPHNISSVRWFMEKVYPLLSANLKIVVIGKIGNFIEDKSNIEKVLFVEDLDNYYKQSRIAICPMLSGTGLKIKIVEAMSYGIPVVCNERGLDGIPNKIDNGCMVSNDPEIFAHNIHLLLADENKYNEYRTKSLAIFNAAFDQKIVYKKLDELFKINR
ncbi:glycosyltransferase [Dysgonomonas sp. ZJ709]|uniref:glycosyltransferase n=1 Tax=Dysgonomonas sp. ZJ709 TaxID=2709797 RepID=UPI0013EC93E7|nr:glycosyltransferase [Dysgonomonas sp. ZJ709]